MSGGSDPQPTAPEQVGGWRPTLSDPALGAVALYALVAMGCAVAAYFTVFTVWAGYDDEGTLLVTLQSFAHGGTLYSGIYSPYGPFYYELFGGLFALTGHAVNTDTSRSIVVVLWVATSLLFGIATQRLTGRLMLGISGMIAAFGTLYVLANEPMHPQVLCVLLLGAFVLMAVFGPRRHSGWAGAAAGAVLGALILTKVNLGAYAVAATVLAAALAYEPLRRRRWLSWTVAAGAVLLPVIVTARDLDIGWVREMVAVYVLATAAVVVAAWPLGWRRDGEREDGTGRWLIGAAVGFGVAFVAILAAIVLNGSSLSDVYDGMVTEAMRVREVNMSQFPMSTAVVDWAIVTLAAAVLSVRLRSGEGGAPSVWPGVLRALAGVVIWLSVARVTPFSLGPSAGNQDSIATVLAWIAAVPPAGVVETPWKRFLRILLPALAVAEALQVYPVAGSQVGIAALTFVPVGALCLADALTSLRAWSKARGRLAVERFGVVTAVILAALAADFAVNTVLRSIATNVSIYRERPGLPFAGAHLLRPLPEDTENYTRLVEWLHRYHCSDFIGYPNVNSLYLWSGIEPPPPDAPGVWIEALDDQYQQRIVNELRASVRPCAIRNEGLAELWLGGRPVPQRPLVRYIFGNFHSVQKVGEFEFMLPNERGAGSGSRG